MRGLASGFTLTVALLATASCATARQATAAAGENPGAATTTVRPAAEDGTADVPGTGWHQASRDESGVLVRWAAIIGIWLSDTPRRAAIRR